MSSRCGDVAGCDGEVPLCRVVCRLGEVGSVAPVVSGRGGVAGCDGVAESIRCVDIVDGLVRLFADGTFRADVSVAVQRQLVGVVAGLVGAPVGVERCSGCQLGGESSGRGGGEDGSVELGGGGSGVSARSEPDETGRGVESCGEVVDGVPVGVAPVRGRWYEHNRRKKLNKKLRANTRAQGEVPEWRRKPVRREDDAVSEESQVLQRSLQEKWTAENRVAKLKAEQQFELLQARDMERIKKMQAAQVMRTTEQAKVQTEKAFGFLAKTGNVPGVVGEGYVEGTVLTNATPGLTRSAGDTISPDSSASMHEYRLALKAVADSEKKVADLERALARLRIVVPEETAEAERYAGARTTFTLDTDGEPPVADDGFVGDDGKYHTYQRLTHPDWTPSMEKAMAKQGFDLSYGDY